MSISYKQTIFNSSWEMATDKHTNRVLSNVLLDNDIKSDMVEAIAHVPNLLDQKKKQKL
jgi:hypothetical protein